MVRLSAVALLLFCFGLQAQERIELGLGAGTTIPVAGESFRQAAETGDGNNFWIGYSLDDNWAVELSNDTIDFDEVNSKHQGLGMGAAYRFTTNFIHPIAKLALTSFQSKSILDDTTNSMGAKAAAGIEASFKYVSVGGLLNFFHILKSDELADLKNTQAWQPALFISFHTALAPTEDDEGDTSISTAPTATAPKN